MPKILMVASEAAPFAKTGGLADVLGALPAALARRGNQVAVLLPRYRNIEVPPEDRVYAHLPVQLGPHRYTLAIDQVIRQGVRYLFTDCPPLYDRPGIYNVGGEDFPDNHLRFAALNHAAVGVARHVFQPDVIHVHDWQTGLVPLLLRENLSGDPTFFGARCILTIHNLGYVGAFPAGATLDLGLDPALYHMEGLEFYGRLSFLKAGIVWADAVTTVSPTYAREIQTPEFGFGLDGLLRSRASKLSGILNGVDYSEWNPETDPHLKANYAVNDLSGKAECKRALLAEMGLPAEDARPLIGVVSRLAHQKGLDLLAEAIPAILSDDVALTAVVSGDPGLEDAFRAMARAWPDRIAVNIGYDEGLAHRVEAGADMFVMPSRYEPCGLNQIYSLRYGTVPVVRATGGLEDTVDEETGFKFSGLTTDALVDAIREAVAAFANRTGWVKRMRAGMTRDFSWDASARAFQELYRGDGRA
jgi:starch synthase